MNADDVSLPQPCQGVGEPRHPPDGYASLLAANVYVLGTCPQNTPADGLSVGAALAFDQWRSDQGVLFIPFFSALERLQAAISEECDYLCLPTRALFMLAPGQTLILDPVGDWGRQFLPDEVRALLALPHSASGRDDLAQPAATAVLSQPREYPVTLVDGLTAFFTHRTNVVAAWLAQTPAPAGDQLPHLLVGVELADLHYAISIGVAEQLMQQAGAVALACLSTDTVLDLMLVIPGDAGLSDQLVEHSGPFYQRQWGSRLKYYLGIGHA